MEKKYVIDIIYDGPKLLVKKNNGLVSINLINGDKFITERHNNFIIGLKKLTDSNFIVECYYSNYLDKIIVSDILLLGSDISNKTWLKRKSEISKLNYNKDVVMSHSIIVSNEEESTEILKTLSLLDYCDGISMKGYSDFYGCGVIYIAKEHLLNGNICI